MKRIFLLLMGLLLISRIIYAGEPRVTDQMITGLQKKFSGASNVLWSQSGEFIRAEFLLEGKFMAAYFNSESELFVTATSISKDALPAKLLSSLDVKIAGRSIASIIKIEKQGCVLYYCIIEDLKSSFIIVSGNKKWHYLTNFTAIDEL